MKKIALISLTSLLSLASFSALAEVKASDAIEYRKAMFQAFKWNMGPMGDMIRGKTPFDAQEFAKRADKLASVSSMPWEAFVAGSYKGKTAVLPAIESKRAQFDQKAMDFEKAAQNLASVAKSGDLATIKTAFGPVGQSCKGCHDQFKD